MKLKKVLTKDRKVDYYEYNCKGGWNDEYFIRIRLRKCLMIPNYWYLTGNWSHDNVTFTRCMILHPRSYTEGVAVANDVLELMLQFATNEVL